jgi:hypothetical protein
MRRWVERNARRARVSVTGYRRTSLSASAKVREPGRTAAGAGAIHTQRRATFPPTTKEKEGDTMSRAGQPAQGF